MNTTAPRKPATVDAINSPTSDLTVSDLVNALEALAAREEFTHPIPRYRVLKRSIEMRAAGETMVLTPGLLKSAEGVRLARLTGTARDRVSRAVKIAGVGLPTRTTAAS
jgi:hypothetical protein